MSGNHGSAWTPAFSTELFQSLAAFDDVHNPDWRLMVLQGTGERLGMSGAFNVPARADPRDHIFAIVQACRAYRDPPAAVTALVETIEYLRPDDGALARLQDCRASINGLSTLGASRLHEVLELIGAIPPERRDLGAYELARQARTEGEGVPVLPPDDLISAVRKLDSARETVPADVPLVLRFLAILANALNGQDKARLAAIVHEIEAEFGLSPGSADVTAAAEAQLATRPDGVARAPAGGARVGGATAPLVAERAAMEGQFTYQDFDLLIEPSPPGSYRARVLQSPAGESAPVQFTLPFSEVELENFVLKVGQGRRRTRGPGRPESAPLKDFGGKLYGAIFQDELQDALQRSLSLTRAQQAGLRLRLRLTDAPELAELPWEFLYDRRHNRFLALSRRTPLVRYLDLPDPPQPLGVEGPLRVLVMISNPSGYPSLDIEQEWSLLTDALAEQQAEGRVIIERLAANMNILRGRLRRETFHVFHFVGHGFYRPDWDDGVLVMEDRHGRPHEVTGEELGGLLNEYDAIRLAVLNACEGARSGASDPFAGMAQSLIQQGLPAVVAMQFEITDDAAVIFARELYGAIGDGFPVEAALAEARGAIRDEGNPTEWGTPVLYSRAPDGHLFDRTDRGRISEADRKAVEKADRKTQKEDADRKAQEHELRFPEERTSSIGQAGETGRVSDQRAALQPQGADRGITDARSILRAADSLTEVRSYLRSRQEPISLENLDSLHKFLQEIDMVLQDVDNWFDLDVDLRYAIRACAEALTITRRQTSTLRYMTVEWTERRDDRDRASSDMGSFYYSLLEKKDELEASLRVLIEHLRATGEFFSETGLRTETPFDETVAPTEGFGFDGFLCHSGKDKEIVAQLSRKLSEAGVRYWLDSEQITFGDPIVQKIENGLHRSRYLLPCVSKNLTSGWSRAEYSAILNAELSGDSTHVVIPIVLDDLPVGEIPPLLRDKKRVSYTNEVEFSEFLQFLLRR